MAFKSSDEDVLEHLTPQMFSQLQNEIRQGFVDSSELIVDEIKKFLSTGSFVPHGAVPILREEGIPYFDQTSDSHAKARGYEDERFDGFLRSVEPGVDAAPQSGATLRKSDLRRTSSNLGIHRYTEHVSKKLTSKNSQKMFATSVNNLLQGVRKRYEEDQARQNRLLYRFVYSKAFSCFCMIMIVADALWMGYESDHREVSRDGWLKTVGLIFNVWFGFVLVLKLVTLRHDFFVGPDYAWNLLDFFLVLTSIPEFLAKSLRLSILRILRLARVTRTFRAMRLLVYLSSLREIMISVLHTLASLFWSFVAMFLATYVWALLFMQFLDLQSDDGLQHIIANNFKTVYFTMITLYSFFSGGLEWYPFVMDFEKHGTYLAEYALLVYVFFMNFGLVNVVIGVFCAKANEASNEDKDLRMQKEQQQYMKMVDDLVKVFNMIDKDEIGAISQEQFLEFANGSETQAILQSYGVPSFAVEKIWRIMDECDGNPNGLVNLTSFIMVFMRLTVHSVSTEIMILSLHFLEMRSDINDISYEIRKFEPALRVHQSGEQSLQCGSTEL